MRKCDKREKTAESNIYLNKRSEFEVYFTICSNAIICLVNITFHAIFYLFSHSLSLCCRKLQFNADSEKTEFITIGNSLAK